MLAGSIAALAGGARAAGPVDISGAAPANVADGLLLDVAFVGELLVEG